MLSLNNDVETIDQTYKGKVMKTITSLGVLPLALLSSMAFSQSIDVTITNLTQGMHFTPLMVSAHSDNMHVFEAGQVASTGLKTMAEGGDISVLLADSEAGAVNVENPADGLLAPSASAMVTDMDTGTNNQLSIVAMVLPTNDGFVGLDSWDIPTEAGTYTVYLNAYDAGSEANDEIINGAGALGMAGIPAAPAGNGGTGATGVTTSEDNQSIHIHRGNTGDTDAAGGISDVDSRIHRWLNPVAKVVVTVK